MKSRSRLMLEKSVAAMLSAIEIYNKPDFKYREETFSVLCINAWELLLKSKVLNLAGNKLGSLFTVEYILLKGGQKSKFPRPKKNRSGNPLSINLFEAFRVITEDYGVEIATPVKDNITALTEIRDNSIHFINDDLAISMKVQELGTASLQNYLQLVKEWFGDILANYNFYLMPLSFFREFDTAKGISLNASEKKLLKYIQSIEEQYDDEEKVKDYNLTLKIEVKFEKVKSKSGLPVQVTNDPTAQKVQLVEEDITDKYPWDYQILTTRLGKRYSNFKVNEQYHRIRKSLVTDSRYAYKRLINPNNPDGGNKVLFNPNIQKAFDKYYLRKT